MNITFEDTALEELFFKGETKSKKYSRLPKDVVKMVRESSELHQGRKSH